jgi:hypothetical protein
LNARFLRSWCLHPPLKRWESKTVLPVCRHRGSNPFLRLRKPRIVRRNPAWVAGSSRVSGEFGGNSVANSPPSKEPRRTQAHVICTDEGGLKCLHQEDAPSSRAVACASVCDVSLASSSVTRAAVRCFAGFRRCVTPTMTSAAAQAMKKGIW